MVRRALPALSLLSLLLVASPSYQLTDCGYCLCDRPTITCDFDKSKTKIVDNIELASFAPTGSLLRQQRQDPASFSEMYINCKNARVLKSQRLSRGLLRDFVNLTRVSIVKCDLVAIDVNALDGLEQLKELDFSDNQLERLPPGFLAGKSLLTVVRLSENRRLSLDADTFRDVSLERLVLSKCNLGEFPLASLEKIRGLQQLTLSQNRVRFVPPGARALVARLKVFYLDDNPISCTCSNRWLREIPWDRVSPSLTKLPKGQLPKCQTPHYLLDAELPALSLSDFPCAPPQLLSVDLDLGTESGRLACTAKSDDQPPQGSGRGLAPLVWTFRQMSAFPPDAGVAGGVYGGRTYQGTGDTLVQSFDRSRHFNRERIQVFASTEDGRQANFTLTVQWPPRRPPVLPNLIGPASGQDSPRLLPQPPPHLPLPTPTQGGDYFSHKQFTLVEMVIAVIGTFLATSLMILLACQFSRWYNRRDKQRWATYVTHPYGYSYTGVSQHQPPGPPSHEYDVPRIDQPCLLKGAHLLNSSGGGSGGSGGSVGGGGGNMAELEFLDYNGGAHTRMLFNRV